MAINIQHTYNATVEIYYYGEDGFKCINRDKGSIDTISERVCKALIKYNFSRAEVCSAKTLELLMVIERS